MTSERKEREKNQFGRVTGVVERYTPTRTQGRGSGIHVQDGVRGESGCRKAPTGVQLVKDWRVKRQNIKKKQLNEQHANKTIQKRAQSVN